MKAFQVFIFTKLIAFSGSIECSWFSDHALVKTFLDNLHVCFIYCINRPALGNQSPHTEARQLEGYAWLTKITSIQNKLISPELIYEAKFIYCCISIRC